MSARQLTAWLAAVAVLAAVYLLVIWPGDRSPAAGHSTSGPETGETIGSTPMPVGPSRHTLAARQQAVEIGDRGSAVAAATPTNANASGELVLRFRNAADLAAFRQAALPFGTAVIDELRQLRAIRLSWQGESARDALLDQFPNASAEANETVFAPEVPRPSTEPGVTQPAAFGLSALEFVGVDSDNATWGQGVIVAILDTGVEAHPVLAGTAIKHLDMLDENAPRDGPYAGHGTAVAAILGAKDPLLRGVAPASTLLDVRVLDGNGVGNAFTVAQGIVAAVDAGADVINMSLGSYAGAEVMREAVNYATAAGVIMVAAVGNDGNDAVLYPAAFANVIAVTAIDANGKRPAFANTGAGIDVAAPGTEVLSGWSDERYVRFTGTSAAAPFVAGAIAAGQSQLQQPVDDWQKLLAWTSNDLGDAGTDAAHGNGTLNLSRLLRSQTPNIGDGAVASHVIDSDAAAEIGNNEIPVTVVVQNRGTQIETLTLDVNMASERLTFEFADLKPGESASAGLAVDAGELRRIGGFDLDTTVRINGDDANPKDNGKVSRLVPLPLPEPEETD